MLKAETETLREKVEELESGMNNTTNDYMYESSFMPTPDTESDYY